MKKTVWIIALMSILVVVGACTTPQQNNQQQPVPQIKDAGCDWKPATPFPFGTCEAVVGAYYDGKQCVTMSGCPAEAAGIIPFLSLEECQNACMQKTTSGTTAQVREFDIEAKQFTFTPDTIRVKKGDIVRLKVTSTDVEHGIAIVDYNINKKVPAGKTEVIEFVADKAGEFEFYCSVFCGSGHKEMEGKLIVE